MKPWREPYSFILATALVGLVCVDDACAYLDPGTGSMVFQAAIGVLLGAVATGKLWWSKVRGIFSRKSDRDDN